MVEAIANNSKQLKSRLYSKLSEQNNINVINYVHIMHISLIYGYFKVSYFTE